MADGLVKSPFCFMDLGDNQIPKGTLGKRYLQTGHWILNSEISMLMASKKTHPLRCRIYSAIQHTICNVPPLKNRYYAIDET
jgi:hypothetical protein